jgi:hypothetical protein
MSLPARQQRALDRIEYSLHVCEPHPKSMFAIFAKLTGGEEIPRPKELQPPVAAVSRPVQAAGAATAEGTGGHWRRATGTPGVRLRVLLMIPVMLLALAPAVLFGLGTRSASQCGSAIRPPHATAALSSPKTCPTSSQILVHRRLPGG